MRKKGRYFPSRAIRGAGIGSINIFRCGFTLKELGAQGPPGRYSSHQPTPARRITASYGVVPVANLGLTRSWATHYTTRLNPVSVEWFRRVAGCATPTGSAGHAGATANLKLTFHPDHSVGANQWGPQQHPHPWHFRAGGGAVHSIKSGQTHRSKKRFYSITSSAGASNFAGISSPLGTQKPPDCTLDRAAVRRVPRVIRARM